MTNTDLNQAMQPSMIFRQCFNCNYESVTAEEICPKCRRNKFFTSNNIRVRGVVVILSGLFIAGLVGGIAVFVGMLLLGSDNDPSSARRLAENEATLLAIYAFFALLICVGLYFVAVGGWMLAFGKRNRVLVWIMWVLIVVVFGAGGVMTAIT